MRALALDTTTRRGSVALVDDEQAIERPGDAARSHAERLPAELLALLESRGLTLADVDLLAVAAGPGSFTGLRIGIATIQGLAFVINRPIVAVSTLDAVAEIAALDAPAGAIVGVLIDAQRGEVYSALYRRADAERYAPERLVRILPPEVGMPDPTIARWKSTADLSAVIFSGDAVARCGPAIERALGGPPARVVNPPALAGTIARMAIARAARGLAVGPAAVHPEYIRRPDAEIDRDRRASVRS